MNSAKLSILLILSLTLALSANAQNKQSDTLPFARKQLERTDFFPIAGLSITYSRSSFSLHELQNFLNETENYFRAQGNDIPHKTIDENVSRQVVMSCYARLYKTFGMQIEIGKALNDDANFWYAAWYALYFHNFKKPNWLKPFIAIGIAKYRYEIHVIYGAYLNADPNQGTLDYISSIGGQKGYSIKVGTDIGYFKAPGYGVGLNLFSAYTKFGELSQNTNGINVKLNLSGFSFGGGLKIFF